MARTVKQQPPPERLGTDLEHRGLPSAETEESLLLGAIQMGENSLIDALVPEHFASERNRLIFTRMADIHQRGETVDRIVLIRELQKREGDIQIAGGLSYLANLDTLMPQKPALGEYVRIVRDRAERRRILRVSVNLEKLVYDDTVATEDLARRAERAFQKVQQFAAREEKTSATASDVIQNFPGGYGAFMSPHKTSPGISTGFPILDDTIYGLQPHMIVFAGTTGSGKTSFCEEIALSVAERKIPVKIFSLEMTGENLIHRMICAKAGISYKRFRRGFLADHERTLLNGAAALVSSFPIHIDETPGVTIRDFESRSRKAVEEDGVQLLIFDYAQLTNRHHSGDGTVYRTSYEAMTDISQRFQKTSKRLHVPVVVLSQFSRERGRREKGDRRPKLSDLKETGSFENDPRVVLLLYRESQDEPHRTDLYGKAELIIAKNSNGPCRTIKYRFNPPSMHFEELPQEEQEFNEDS